MAQQVDMLETYYRKAGLPAGLRIKQKFPLKPEVEALIGRIKEGSYKHQLILLCGLKPGKTVNAAALLRVWLKSIRNRVEQGIPGYFISVHQICYQNRSIDRYNRDENLRQTIYDASLTDFLVLDGVFSYLTQNDDLLLQSLYDARQHSAKTTIVTTSIIDPLECAGSVLYRIARDANLKVVF